MATVGPVIQDLKAVFQAHGRIRQAFLAMSAVGYTTLAKGPYHYGRPACHVDLPLLLKEAEGKESEPLDGGGSMGMGVHWLVRFLWPHLDWLQDKVAEAHSLLAPVFGGGEGGTTLTPVQGLRCLMDAELALDIGFTGVGLPTLPHICYGQDCAKDGTAAAYWTSIAEFNTAVSLLDARVDACMRKHRSGTSDSEGVDSDA